MTIRPKRQSTTAKITRTAYRHIAAYFAVCPDAGFIVRYKGKEYGCIGQAYGKLHTVEGIVLDAYRCTVRKGTIEAIIDDTNTELVTPIA